ncbi:MAG: hypothetical protein ACXVAJ_07865, partial [Parachlamydiaceae bacterium]
MTSSQSLTSVHYNPYALTSSGYELSKALHNRVQQLLENIETHTISQLDIDKAVQPLLQECLDQSFYDSFAARKNLCMLLKIDNENLKFHLLCRLRQLMDSAALLVDFETENKVQEFINLEALFRPLLSTHFSGPASHHSSIWLYCYGDIIERLYLFALLTENQEELILIQSLAESLKSEINQWEILISTKDEVEFKLLREIKRMIGLLMAPLSYRSTD